MATVIDDLGTWEQLGTVLVDNQWRLFSVPTISEIFRVTTVILNAEDWDKKLRSGIYIRFLYPNPEANKSKKYYIRVEPDPSVIEIQIPEVIKDRGYFLRDVQCIMSHPKAGKVSLASFARVQLKLEGYL